MTIKFKSGNIFNSRCDLRVIPVNTVGIMGKSLALQFKNRHYDLYKIYKEASIINYFDRNNFMMFKFERYLLFPTKNHWRDNSNLKDIGHLLNELRKFCIENSKISIAIPKIACGCGNLNWNDVKKLIIDRFEDLENVIEIYE